MKNMTAKDVSPAGKAGFRCDFPVSMRSFALCLASMTALAASALTDVYWIGGSSGNWNDASNWSSVSYPDSSDCHVKITNETPVTISLGSGTFKLGSLSFSGADHKLTGDSTTSGLLTFYGGKTLPDVPVIDVQQGRVATINYARAGDGHGGCGISKQGAGALVINGAFGLSARFELFEIAQGVVSNCYPVGNGFTLNGRCIVRSGATFASTANNSIDDYVVIELEEGAVFDNCNKRDGYGGFTGYGTVKGTSNTGSYWNSAPLEFGGLLYGIHTLNPTVAHTSVEGGGYLVVGASNTLANADIVILGDAVYTNILRFAPGVGTFYIKSVKTSKPDPLVLEDTNGDPITLSINGQPQIGITGCGNYLKTSAGTLVLTGDLYTATGTLSLKTDWLHAGNLVAGYDATGLERLGMLETFPGTTFTMRNHDDTTWNVAILGDGTVTHEGLGVWTLNNLSMTNGTFTISDSSTAGRIVLAGGTSKFGAYNVSPTTYTTVVTGGDYTFPGTLKMEQGRKFEQTGGTVRCCLQANHVNTNEIYYTISGGTLISRATAAVNNYPQGVGMDISGDAHVELRHENSYFHRISSGNSSHTIRLSGNAYLGVDGLLIIGEYTSCATGTLELAGGVMEVNGNLNVPAGMAQSTDAYGRIIFDGGLLRAMMPGRSYMTWSSNEDPNEHLKGYVRSGGAIIDVSESSYTPYLVINWPFVSDVEEGIDGGLEKRGLAQLTLRKPYRATGPVNLRDGTILVDTGCGTTPFGTANMRIGGGLMKFAGADVTVNPASGAPLTYENGATLSLSSGTHLTLGAAGAAPGSAIARDGHGVLLVMSGAAGTALGASSSITVNGGLENDPSTGILRQPIFERRQVTGNVNPYRARFLKCDANNELVPATTVEFDPSTSTSATVAEITSAAASVSGNVSVGALNVELSPKGKGLTIAENATLTIGSGNAGSVAPLLLNNVSTGSGVNDNAGIAGGGKIDFGESEGVIVFNSNAGYLVPVVLECVLSGSGGVTFAAPMRQFDGLGCRGAAEIRRASTYTGGTWIQNMQVAITKEGGLGSGTVRVCGDLDGGSLMIPGNYDSSKFTNALELAGSGPSYPDDSVNPRYYGTLIVRKGGVAFSGGVTLKSDAIIATGSRGGRKAVDFTAPITGPGSLTVRGTSPVRFSAANTYAGGTVITNGVVEVADAGSLGTGPVVIMPGGVLRFINGSPKTISNVITGEGKIEMNSAAVTLTAADGFQGETSGNGSVSGGGGYVKSGDGVASFTGALPYTGATTVEAGTLRLGYAPCDILPATDAVAFRLDASATDTITETDGRVTSWADADGRDIAFANTVEYAPTRTASALDGKDVVNFDGQPKRGLVATAAIPELRTVFFVTRVASTHPNSFSNMGLFGKAGADFGLRFLDANTIKADSMFLEGVIHVNGTSAMTFVWGAQPYDKASVPNNRFNLIEAEAAIPVQNATLGIGDYWATTYKRSYCGDIAEVVAYDRWLSDVERIEVERHLQSKWGLAEAAPIACTNVLPVSTDLTVARDAILDLAGGIHEVASLSGMGLVTNSSAGTATLRLASGTSVFAGTFGGDIYLEVAAGATLDLGGGSLTVRKVGGAGQIVNGTLIVTDEIQPGGVGTVGTLAFETAPVADGATLVIDGDGTSVDAISVGGDFELAGLSLCVSDMKSIPGGRYTVVAAGNALGGTFSATNLPGGRRCRIVYDASNAILVHNIGTVIVFH